MELGGWERAHGYAANAHLIERYGNRVPVRADPWDNRHFWRVSNAEQLAMSEDCGLINLSHFAVLDVSGPDHLALMEWVCAARIGGDANVDKGIYTHFLDDEGMVRSDLTVFRMADRCRVVDGADAGPRDFHYLRRVAADRGFDVEVEDVSDRRVTIGIWGPNARAKLAEVVADPDGLSPGNFPFAAVKPVAIAGREISAFRISYVGEQGFELHMAYDDGLAGGVGRPAVGGDHGGRHRDLRQQPPAGEEPPASERRSPDRIQPAGGRPRPPEGEGGGFPGQGETPGAPRPHASARHPVHAGDDGQPRRARHRALPGGHPSGAGPRHGGDPGG